MFRAGFLLAVIVLAVVFAAQNADVVNLSLLAWNLNASLAVIIVLCFALGALAAALALMPGIYRSRAEQRKTNRRLAELEYGSQNGVESLSPKNTGASSPAVTSSDADRSATASGPETRAGGPW
jgi:putative membrane protein